MNRRIGIAVLIQLTLMVIGLVPPLIVRSTGTVLYLETEPVDPRALFRGDYVILGYPLGREAGASPVSGAAGQAGDLVYVTVTNDRPARFIAASTERPELGAGQSCLKGRAVAGRSTVVFPQITQLFVPEGTGREIERRRGTNLLAKVAASRSCDAVLLGVEAR